MTLSRRDFGFYYNQAAFKTFRKGKILFLVVDVPKTTESLAHTFQLYDLIKLLLPTPEIHDYYCMLSTDITTIGFSLNADADHLIQITDHRQPTDMNIWHASDVTLTFLDKTRPTCVRGLIEARLSEIKATCRYKVHKPIYPRSVNRLHGNTFLLTNITELHFQCPTQQFGNNNTEHVLDLEGIQTINKFDCHCDMIHADEFRIVPDLDFCNESEDTTAISTIH